MDARKIITLAERDVGRREDPGRPNRSAWLDPIQRRVSVAHRWDPGHLLGQPWCGTWLWDIFERVGHPTDLAHPSTAVMWARAQERGRVVADPLPGDIIIWPGIHTGLVVAVDHAAGVAHTIEGNSGDAVTRRVRAIRGSHSYIRVPGGLQGALVQTVWGLEDLRARPRVHGPWRARRSAERALAGMRPDRRRVSAVLRTGDGRFVVREGSPRNYGPWVSQAGRDAAQATLERRLGRRLRRWRRTRRVPPATTTASAPEALGKTT